MKTNVVLVDDHILIADALKSIISNFRDFEVSYTYEHGAALIEHIHNRPLPDIILLDIGMPVMDGFETATWLKNQYPKIPVMALSMQDDDQSLIKMIKAGAKGYLLKNTSPKNLELAFKNLIAKGQYFPEWAASKIITSIRQNDDNVQHSVVLSDREQEFLSYVATEMTYKEIAEKMFCSPRTVENYRDSLFEKLDLKSRVGIAVYAVKQGFDT